MRRTLTFDWATIAFSLGLGASLSWMVSQGQAGSFGAQSVAWGLSFMLGIYVTGGVSGGHLNPAITISLSVWRGFPAKLCVIYILMQIIGAITAGGGCICNLPRCNHQHCHGEQGASEPVAGRSSNVYHAKTLCASGNGFFQRVCRNRYLRRYHIRIGR